MNALIKMLVGMHKYGPGTDARLRSGVFGEQIVNDAGLGRYYEMVRHGLVYTSMVKAVTIAATHNSPIAANTATPVLGLANQSVNKAAVLLRASFLTTSGTPAGGQAVINVQPNGVKPLTAATTGSIFNNLPGGGGISPQGSQMRALNNVALAGWLATPDPVQELFLLGGASAAAAAGNGGPGMAGEDLGGLVIVPPGALCALMCGSGAGTSWIVNASWTWAEVDYSLIAG